MPAYQSPMSPQCPRRDASHKRYAVPDTADRAACARFRMRRRKVSRGPACSRSSECHPTIAKLQETILELSCQLNRLYETVLQQALAFRDHLSSCSAMMHDMTHLILTTASMSATFPERVPHTRSIPFPLDLLSCTPTISRSHTGSCPNSPSSKTPDDVSHSLEPPGASPSFCFRPSVVVC